MAKGEAQPSKKKMSSAVSQIGHWLNFPLLIFLQEIRWLCSALVLDSRMKVCFQASQAANP